MWNAECGMRNDPPGAERMMKERKSERSSREAGGLRKPLEGDEDNFLDHLKPKSEARSTKQIRMTKITMTKT